MSVKFEKRKIIYNNALRKIFCDMFFYITIKVIILQLT